MEKMLNDDAAKERYEQRAKEKEPPGNGIFSRRVAPRVSSALERFTSVFGMGTGGSAPLQSPKGSLWEEVYTMDNQDTSAIRETRAQLAERTPPSGPA